MEKRAETVIPLPWDVVDACNGFSLDIGGSVMKFAYIHKDDWIEKAEDRKKDTCPVRLVVFAREEMDKSFAYLESRLLIKRKTPDEKPLIYTTGIGGSQFMNRIKDEFKVTTEVLTEMDLFVATHFHLLKEMPRNQIVHENIKLKAEDVKKDFPGMLKVINRMLPSSQRQCAMDEVSDGEVQQCLESLQKEDPDGNKPFCENEDVFPCFLVMCGSGGGAMIVNKDGTFGFSIDLYRIGRTFYGLGSLLTGAKSYGELMDLAVKGTDKAVHEYLSEITTRTVGGDGFVDDSSNATEFPAFVFGKGASRTRSDFKAEDLSRALLHGIITDIVQHMYHATNHFGIKHVFFCGNFVNHPLKRQLIYQHWIYKYMEQKFLFSSDADFAKIHFLKYGGHYGALGGFLNGKLKFTEKMGEMAAKAAENRKKDQEEKGSNSNSS